MSILEEIIIASTNEIGADVNMGVMEFIRGVGFMEIMGFMKKLDFP